MTLSGSTTTFVPVLVSNPADCGTRRTDRVAAAIFDPTVEKTVPPENVTPVASGVATNPFVAVVLLNDTGPPVGKLNLTTGLAVQPGLADGIQTVN